MKQKINRKVAVIMLLGIIAWAIATYAVMSMSLTEPVITICVVGAGSLLPSAYIREKLKNNASNLSKIILIIVPVLLLIPPIYVFNATRLAAFEFPVSADYPYFVTQITEFIMLGIAGLLILVNEYAERRSKLYDAIMEIKANQNKNS